jgi:competence protein ComGC
MRSRCGMILVELIVINAIIGILVSLLLPAVQAAREAGQSLRESTDPRVVAAGTALKDITDGTSNTALAAQAALGQMLADGRVDRDIIGILIGRLRQHRRDADALLTTLRRLSRGSGPDRLDGTDRHRLREAAGALLQLRRVIDVARSRLRPLVGGSGDDA